MVSGTVCRLGLQTTYDANYHAWQEEEANRSASRVVPVARQLLSPRSVIDVGCGNDAWLAAFRAAGVEDLVGIDGESIEFDRVLIPSDWRTLSSSVSPSPNWPPSSAPNRVWFCAGRMNLVQMRRLRESHTR